MPDHLRNDIWVKCERGPSTDHISTQLFANSLLLSSNTFGPDDRVTLFKTKPIRASLTWRKIRAKISEFSLRDLLHLLRTVSENPLRYRLGTANCWWYAGVVFAALPADEGSDLARKAENRLMGPLRALQGAFMTKETEVLLETLKRRRGNGERLPLPFNSCWHRVLAMPYDKQSDSLTD